MEDERHEYMESKQAREGTEFTSYNARICGIVM